MQKYHPRAEKGFAFCRTTILLYDIDGFMNKRRKFELVICGAFKFKELLRSTIINSISLVYSFVSCDGHLVAIKCCEKLLLANIHFHFNRVELYRIQ